MSDGKLIGETQEHIVELAVLVAQLNEHTANLRTEIARLIEVIREDQQKRES